MKVILTRLDSNHTKLRTDVIEGEAMGLPIVGVPFVLVGEPITEGAQCRVVQTTGVTGIEKVDEFHLIFTTKNSKYSLVTF